MRYETDKNGCWNFLGGLDQYGYGKLAFKGRTISAHRMMAHICLKPLMSDAEVVAHKCDNRKCINPAHLFITTSQGNTKDRDEKGRGAIGERHPLAKLTSDDVRVIRRMYAEGNSLRKIAEHLNKVSIGCIQHVTEGKTWRHVH